MGFVGMHLKDHLNFDATEWILLIPIDVLEHGQATLALEIHFAAEFRSNSPACSFNNNIEDLGLLVQMCFIRFGATLCRKVATKQLPMWTKKTQTLLKNIFFFVPQNLE